jgi:hypothetical protein
MIRPLPQPSAALLALSEEYFSFLARHLPVCCLSDEFHFMPRVESARFYQAGTDRLDREFLEGACAKVKAWRAELRALAGQEDAGLLGLLGQSMDSFLVHWEALRLWRRDPGVYLKVAFIGLDQALSRPTGENEEAQRDLRRARLDAIPGLLSWGMRQVRDVPRPARAAALDMVGSCRDFLARAVAERAEPPGVYVAEMERKERAAFEALERFQAFLQGLGEAEEFAPGEDLFQEILGAGYGWKGGIGRAREVFRQEASDKERELARLAAEIDPNKTWREIYEGIGLPEMAYRDTVSLYRGEVERLAAFFGRQGSLPIPPGGSVRVEPTPAYLQPIRATASYSAPPFLGEGAAEGRFFVQISGEDAPSEQGRRRLESVHREYRYLAAHETYPGHHVLDFHRLLQTDPIRRRIESALFYEGWACYAEQLVDDLGYDPDPGQRLIRLKRDLWRAVRGSLDLDLHTGSISLEEAAGRLASLGYAAQDARKQARRIPLTPGYQVCYTLGKHAFLDLRRRHVPPLYLKDLHAIVLGSGQVPFACLDQALDASFRREG